MHNLVIYNNLRGLLYGTKQVTPKAKELSALSVSKIKSNDRHAVGCVNGLHLRIINNSRAWILRVVVEIRADEFGKVTSHRRDIGLASYPYLGGRIIGSITKVDIASVLEPI